jgi:hypothetical protein
VSYWTNPVNVGMVIKMGNGEYRYVSYMDDGAVRRSLVVPNKREPIHLYQRPLGWHHVHKPLEEFLNESEWSEEGKVYAQGFEVLPGGGVRMVESEPSGQSVP